MLSQEEIDALLRGDNIQDEDEQPDAPPAAEEEYLSDIEKDALGEVGNISFGSSATALSTLLNQKVEITTPRVSVVENQELDEEFPLPHVSIKVEYTEGLSGVNLLVIKQQDAAIIADLMLGGDGTSPEEELNDIHLSAVQEAMNQMMGSAATSMSTVFNKKVDISPPTINLLDLNTGEGVETIPNEEVLVKVSFQLKVGNLIDSNIMQLLPLDFAKALVNQLMNSDSDSSDQQEPAEHSVNIDEQADLNPPQPEMNKVENHSAEPKHVGGNTVRQDVSVQPAAFADLESAGTGIEVDQRNLNMLLDIPLKVSVELGRTKKTIKEILELTSGSIIELDKLAGEPVDIHVNDKLIAKGEVVVIDENFGVRLTDILSQSDRLKKLR
ncbi:MAG: flagellar motor switch phosphatase FliY [Bacillaceae bacterium]|nr:flagellar motor switch phosphatase FliY [Bacillaceae bacterium]